MMDYQARFKVEHSSIMTVLRCPDCGEVIGGVDREGATLGNLEGVAVQHWYDCRAQMEKCSTCGVILEEHETDWAWNDYGEAVCGVNFGRQMALDSLADDDEEPW